MPSVTLHASPRPAPPSSTNGQNNQTPAQPESPLPPLLHTPHGLAIIEIQGTLNIPPPTHATDSTPPAAPHPAKPSHSKPDTHLLPPDAMDTEPPSSSPIHEPPSSPYAHPPSTTHAQQPPPGNTLTEHDADASAPDIPIGRLVFANPDLCPPGEPSTTSKKVYFYVGKSQRLVGEMKVLPRPYAVIRKREGDWDAGRDGVGGAEELEELEIMDVVRYKIYFGGRPEFV